MVMFQQDGHLTVGAMKAVVDGSIVKTREFSAHLKSCRECANEYGFMKHGALNPDDDPTKPAGAMALSRSA